MTSEQIILTLEKRKKAFASQCAEKLSKEAERMTRRNFNEFAHEVSSDYQNVAVARTKLSDTSYRISCVGNQVIFIEFGVGAENVQGTRGSGNRTIDYFKSSTFSYADEGRTRIVENAPRPAGVVGLGRYGKGHGKDDYWVRPSIDGVPKTATESHVHKKNGDVRTDVVWTMGHRPARALYRGFMNALNKLLGGKL